MDSNEEKKITRVFQMSANTAETFFWIVKWSTDHGVEDTVKLRKYILDWLMQNEQMQRVVDTKRSEEQIVSDYKQQGYNIQDHRNPPDDSIWGKFKRWIK